MKMGMRVRLEESFRLSYFLFIDSRFFNIRYVKNGRYAGLTLTSLNSTCA